MFRAAIPLMAVVCLLSACVSCGGEPEAIPGPQGEPVEPGQQEIACESTTPVGIYDGTISVVHVLGDDPSCEETPPGFTIPMRMAIHNDGAVRERHNSCTVLDDSPEHFVFECANHDYWEVCDTDPADDVDGCAAYNQTRYFTLQFSQDADHVTGTLADLTDWGCTARLWKVEFERRPLPVP
jgi:hypothetical protein